MKTMSLLEREESIRFVKQTFNDEISKQLSLSTVSAPIFVKDGMGINDDLNGIERPVIFPMKSLNDQKASIVQSLAKWKRIRLKELEIEEGRGIITDMRALRPDEDYSPIHSMYVDQWDWEKHIATKDRSLEYLKTTVLKIYEALKATEKITAKKHDDIRAILPEEITFIQSEDLYKKHPSLTPKQREDKAAEEFGAIFIIGIGKELSNGEVHDGRAPDYDDWISKSDEGYFGLNGDIIVWNPILKSAFELSSMGIRVSKESLLEQLAERGLSERSKLSFHQMLLDDYLPQSIGGGIGQSRVCMFMLRKSHIGEVQVSIWPEKIREQLAKEGVTLL